MFTLLDSDLAAEAREEAMLRAYVSAPSVWVVEAHMTIDRLSHRLPFFTSDDVWRELWKPPEPRAIGPVFTAMARDGYIEFSGRYVKSQQVSRHNTEIKVWNSLVYRPTQH
jgi:hypothetical protein